MENVVYIKRTLDYIEAHLTETLTVETCAKVAGFSTIVLCVYGSTCHGLYSNMRI